MWQGSKQFTTTESNICSSVYIKVLWFSITWTTSVLFLHRYLLHNNLTCAQVFFPKCWTLQTEYRIFLDKKLVTLKYPFIDLLIFCVLSLACPKTNCKLISSKENKPISPSFLHDHWLPVSLAGFSAAGASSCFFVWRIEQCPPWTPRIVRTWPLPHTWWRIGVLGRSAHTTALRHPRRCASPQTAAQTGRPRRPRAATCNVPSVWGTSAPAEVGW